MGANRVNQSGADFPNSTPGSAAPSAQTRRKTDARVAIASVLWFLIVAGGTLGMMRYANTPGVSGEAPKVWPVESQIPKDDNCPTLVMFAHPHCPCTRASIGELEVLLARFHGQVNAHVVFLKPAKMEINWEKSDLWRTASSIPGVTVSTDDGGIEARRFHSETSGETLLYDKSGVLKFQGGITLSRGHAGDNPGRSALQELLLGKDSASIKTPVFGCSLFETNCQGGTLCKP